MKNTLRELRNGARLTQDQLAEYLNMDRSMIEELENGNLDLNMTIVDKVCCLFGCTEAYLLNREDSCDPVSFEFGSEAVTQNVLESIAAVNRIIFNLREMNEIMTENGM